MNLICKNCTNNVICTIYKDINKHRPHLEISISNCEYYRGVENVVKEKNFCKIEKTESVRDKIDRLSKEADRARKESIKKNKQDKPKVSIKTGLQAIPLKLDVTCKSCGATTFKEDVINCEECGKEICSSCGVIDGDSRKYICSDCWNK